MEAKHIKQTGWYVAAGTFVGVNLTCTALGFTGMMVLMPGILGAAAVKFALDAKAATEETIIREPAPKFYNLPRTIVMGVIKETIPNINVEDRWWILHWMNQDKGQMKFRVNYEPSSKKGERERQQIVLNVYVSQPANGPRTLLTLRYEITAKTDRDTANDLITSTTESIDYQLTLEEQRKLQ